MRGSVNEKVAKVLRGEVLEIEDPGKTTRKEGEGESGEKDGGGNVEEPEKLFYNLREEGNVSFVYFGNEKLNLIIEGTIIYYYSDLNDLNRGIPVVTIIRSTGLMSVGTNLRAPKELQEHIRRFNGMLFSDLREGLIEGELFIDGDSGTIGQFENPPQ